MSHPADDPYALADAALRACQRHDAAAWRALLVPGADPTLPDADDLAGVSGPMGLYFQDERVIAAVLRLAADGAPAVWLRIVRSGDGFLVAGLERTAADPDTELPVEG
ncbi:MAG TPA: hypothetical protein PKA64_19685 [Myxococcota bacterium]|nr:hypothetical protein [Myxococcota bacterium]